MVLQTCPRWGQPLHPRHYLAAPGKGMCPGRRSLQLRQASGGAVLPTAAGWQVGALGAPVHCSPHCNHHTCNSDVVRSSSFGTPLALLLGELQGKVSLSLSWSWSQGCRRSSLPSTTHPEGPSPWLGTSAGFGSLSDHDPNPHPWELKSLVVMPFSDLTTAFTVKCGQWTEGCPITSPGCQADAFLPPLHDSSPDFW